jgi:hypothetical protein
MAVEFYKRWYMRKYIEILVSDFDMRRLDGRPKRKRKKNIEEDIKERGCKDVDRIHIVHNMGPPSCREQILQ